MKAEGKRVLVGEGWKALMGLVPRIPDQCHGTGCGELGRVEGRLARSDLSWRDLYESKSVSDGFLDSSVMSFLAHASCSLHALAAHRKPWRIEAQANGELRTGTNRLIVRAGFRWELL